MPATTSKMRVLLVEDESMVARALGRVLRGHDLVHAEDYHAARQVLERQAVDLVLSDNVIPGPGGIEVLRMARELCPQAVRVMISGALPANVDALVASGLIHRAFNKPWGHDLASALEQLVADRDG